MLLRSVLRSKESEQPDLKRPKFDKTNDPEDISDYERAAKDRDGYEESLKATAEEVEKLREENAQLIEDLATAAGERVKWEGELD